MSSGGGGGGIGASLGGIIGGYVGADAASGDKAKGQGYAENAFQELLNLGLPPDLSKEIIYQKFQEAGILNPQMEQEIELAHSKVAQMQEAPETRNAQMEALQQLKQLSRGGLGAQDRAALNQVRDSTQRDLEAKRQQILQNAQARGMGGSGNELISQLQASQGSANQASMEGDRLAAMAQERALQALGQSANLAGGIRSQDYQQQLAKSSAEDELGRFNVQNQIARQQRNVGVGNLADAQNLANKQRLQDANTQQGNQELLRQGEAKRQNWLDQITRNDIRSNALGGLSNQYSGRAATKAKSKQDEYTAWGGLISNIAKAVTTGGTSLAMPGNAGGGGGQFGTAVAPAAQQPYDVNTMNYKYDPSDFEKWKKNK